MKSQPAHTPALNPPSCIAPCCRPHFRCSQASEAFSERGMSSHDPQNPAAPARGRRGARAPQPRLHAAGFRLSACAAPCAALSAPTLQATCAAGQEYANDKAALLLAPPELTADNPSLTPVPEMRCHLFVWGRSPPPPYVCRVQQPAVASDPWVRKDGSPTICATAARARHAARVFAGLY